MATFVRFQHFFLILALQTALLGAEDQSERTHASQSFPTTISTIEAIASRYDARIGIEFAADDADQVPLTLDLSATSLSKIFDALVAQKPRYRWELDSGVYNIRPAHVDDDILDVRLRSYSVDTPDLATIWSTIDKRPEIKSWLKRNRVRRNDLSAGSPRRDLGQSVSLTLRDITLRTLLNELAKKTKRNWIINHYGNRAQYIGIYLR